jgi:hypothetical protein
MLERRVVPWLNKDDVLDDVILSKASKASPPFCESSDSDFALPFGASRGAYMTYQTIKRPETTHARLRTQLRVVQNVLIIHNCPPH